MPEDLFQIPDGGPDSQQEPQATKSDPLVPLHDAFVPDDAMLDALERNIENPTFGSVCDQDSLARQLDAVESCVTPSIAANPNPVVGQTSEASVIQDITRIKDNPGLESETAKSENRFTPQDNPGTMKNRIQSIPEVSNCSSGNPYLNPRSIRRGRKPRHHLPKGLRTTLFRGLLPGRRRLFLKPLSAPFFHSLDTTACAERNYEIVEKQVCQSCPNYQVWPVTGHQECVYSWELLQSTHDHESSEDSQSGEEDFTEL
jgi:hypothetical protein